MERKRLPAIKTDIKSVMSGRYVAKEGFDPNYVLSPFGRKLSRIRVLGTVVDKFMSENGKFASVTIDDGSDTIRAKVFNALSILDGIENGDVVDLIGKVREYEEELYVMPELLTKKDINWELLRKLELKKEKEDWTEKRKKILEMLKETTDLEELKKVMKERFDIEEIATEGVIEAQDMITEVSEEPTKNGEAPVNKNAKNTILTLLDELDKGDGADYAEIMEKSGLSEDVLDTIINNLLEDGTCFEPKPGKIKKL